jgi:hypothetical protein
MPLTQGYISNQLLTDLQAHADTLSHEAGDAFLKTYVRPFSHGQAASPAAGETAAPAPKRPAKAPGRR